MGLDLRASEGLHACFHGGVEWRSFQPLINRGKAVIVETEKTLRVSGRRYIPDLTVRCAQTGQLLLLIEVWHSHAISQAKRKAFDGAGLPWVEVKAWHVVNRFRGHPLAILDWGGVGPDAPIQIDLFDAPKVATTVQNEAFDNLMDSWKDYSITRFPLCQAVRLAPYAGHI